MSLILKDKEILKKGADLWILPHWDQSEWTPYIDWLIGFQIITQEKSDKALLTLTAKELPNKYTLSLPFLTDETTWLETALKKWEEFSKPSVRVFLPSYVNETKLNSYFKGKDIEVVLNKE